jgi:hypothetical protein
LGVSGKVESVSEQAGGAAFDFARPGPGGAASVLGSATASAHFFDGVARASLSVPSFYDNFDIEQGRITNDEINRQLDDAVNSLSKSSVSVFKQAV